MTGIDKVRFQAQERLDLVDARAIQDLVGQYLGEALGGLMGNSAGALTSIEYSTTVVGGVYKMHFKPFQYYWSEPASIEEVIGPDGVTRSVAKKYKGVVISFDPADEGQAEDFIDWTLVRDMWENNAQPADNGAGYSDHRAVHGGYGFSPGQATGIWLMPLLWARPFTMDTDTDARREWNVAAQQELPISIKTRTRVRTELAFNQETPTILAEDTNQNQWVAIARVAAWNYDSGVTNANGAYVPDVPLLEPIYVWDNHFNVGDTETNAGNLGSGGTGQGAAGFASEDGGASPWPGGAAKPAPSQRSGPDFFENAPFENDGSTISNLARGKWLPGSVEGTGTPLQTGTPHPPQAGGGTADWPYPGSYYDLWNDQVTDGEALGTQSWVSLKDEGFNVDDGAIWRLGIPQVMSIMRRQLAVIMDSRMNRPWYAMPTDTGGLFQIRSELQKQTNLEQSHHDDSVQHDARMGQGSNDPEDNVVIAAAGRVWGNPWWNEQGQPASQLAMKTLGFGLILEDSGSTSHGTFQEFTTTRGNTQNATIISVTLGEVPYGCHYDELARLTGQGGAPKEASRGPISPYYHTGTANGRRGLLGDYGDGDPVNGHQAVGDEGTFANSNRDPVLSRTYVTLGKSDGTAVDTHFTLWSISDMTKTVGGATTKQQIGTQWAFDTCVAMAPTDPSTTWYPLSQPVVPGSLAGGRGVSGDISSMAGGSQTLDGSFVPEVGCLFFESIIANKIGVVPFGDDFGSAQSPAGQGIKIELVTTGTNTDASSTAGSFKEIGDLGVDFGAGYVGFGGNNEVDHSIGVRIDTFVTVICRTALSSQ